jgi:CubicO group peptidase (beta-lactamase class C family)
MKSLHICLPALPNCSHCFETELSAIVRDLLKSRSGIYIEASGETASMREARPPRGQHDPGEFLDYNNWGFNVLGAIFEQETGMTIGQALDEWIARPTGMTSFRPDHVIYVSESGSQYRQFVIYMSASDLARFGALYIQGGQWAGEQIIPANWIEESLIAYSPIPSPEPFDGYGYMWWLDSIGQTTWADG